MESHAQQFSLAELSQAEGKKRILETHFTYVAMAIFSSALKKGTALQTLPLSLFLSWLLHHWERRRGGLRLHFR